MTFAYLFTPFVAWFTAGTLKFIVNSIKAKQSAHKLIGYGGMPSNHSAIVSSITALIAIKEGIEHPAFGVALTFSFIVMLDAASLRRQVGVHASYINKQLTAKSFDHPQKSLNLPLLRERMGHSPIEILAGIVVGILVATLINAIEPAIIAAL